MPTLADAQLCQQQHLCSLSGIRVWPSMLLGKQKWEGGPQWTGKRPSLTGCHLESPTLLPYFPQCLWLTSLAWHVSPHLEAKVALCQAQTKTGTVGAGLVPPAGGLWFKISGPPCFHSGKEAFNWRHLEGPSQFSQLPREALNWLCRCWFSRDNPSLKA